MRKTIFLSITIIIIAGMVLPILGIDWGGGSSPNLSTESNQSSGSASTNDLNNPLATLNPTLCLLGSRYKEEWDLVVCESFDERTDLWEGNSDETKVYVEDGSYVIDNSNTESPSGYSLPVLVGVEDNAMVSVTGSMNCLQGDCGWGVFMRSTLEEIRYVFMIDSEGGFTLTGLSNAETSQEIGNIQKGTHPAILSDGENTITAISEGVQMIFYVNDQLLATYNAADASNGAFGLIVWGGFDAKSINRFDSVLARRNQAEN